jgi:hypothetical protein
MSFQLTNPLLLDLLCVPQPVTFLTIMPAAVQCCMLREFSMVSHGLHGNLMMTCPGCLLYSLTVKR